MIRRYREDDLQAVLDVWERSARNAYHFLDDAFFVSERMAIEQTWMPIAETWVYEGEHGVAGFIALLGNEVGAIFVPPELQGRGIGRALMDHACALRGNLELDVFEENHNGRRFYERYGFKLIGRKVDELTGEPQLRLALPPE